MTPYGEKSERGPMSMADLGLTADQENLYRRLLRDPHTDLDAAGAGQVLAELRALGLVDGALTAVHPAVAIDLLVQRRIEQTRRQLAGLTVAWDLLTELAEEHRSGRPVRMVEHIPDEPAVTRRVYMMLAEHPGEFAHLKTTALTTGAGYEELPHYDHAPFRRSLATGLRSRTLFPAHVLEDPAQEPYVRQWHAQGALHCLHRRGHRTCPALTRRSRPATRRHATAGPRAVHEPWPHLEKTAISLP